MRDDRESLLEGLYESLITQALQERLSGLGDFEVHIGAIDEADAPDVLARHVRDVTLRALRLEKNPSRRLELVNELVQALGASEDSVESAQQLLSVTPPRRPGAQARMTRGRPTTPLSDDALLTNAPGEPVYKHRSGAARHPIAPISTLTAVLT